MHRLSLRTAAALAVGGLTLALLPGGTAVATPDARSFAEKADRAAGWETTQLRNGRINSVAFDVPDWGLTLDTYLGLVAAGTKPRQARDVIRTVSKNVRRYVSFRGDFYAGAVAKTLLARRVAGLDASIDRANLNLRRKLGGMVIDSGRQRGRVGDTGETDYSNTLSQAFSVLGFGRSGRLPRSTVAFLLRQQCPRGFFRLEMTARNCNRDDGTADVDATAFAVQALVKARREGVDLPRGAVRDTARWLTRAQNDNGSFSGRGLTKGANTNSTGVAAQALKLVNRDAAARQAARWISGLQLTRRTAAGTPARTDLGAIAYNRADFRAARRDGITRTTRDTWRRATPQAISGLAPKPLTTLHAR